MMHYYRLSYPTVSASLQMWPSCPSVAQSPSVLIGCCLFSDSVVVGTLSETLRVVTTDRERWLHQSQSIVHFELIYFIYN